MNRRLETELRARITQLESDAQKMTSALTSTSLTLQQTTRAKQEITSELTRVKR